MPHETAPARPREDEPESLAGDTGMVASQTEAINRPGTWAGTTQGEAGPHEHSIPGPLLIKGLKGAARATGLGLRTVWSLTNRNALPHRRVGCGLYYVRAELEAWIEAVFPTGPGAGYRIRKEMRR